MMKLRSDPSRKTLWAFSESQISQYKISNESRDVWKLYLERKEFDLAKEYCKHNDAQMDLVWRKQGESLYNEKKWVSVKLDFIIFITWRCFFAISLWQLMFDFENETMNLEVAN